MTCSEPGRTICPKCGEEQELQLLKSFRRLRRDCFQCFALKRNRLDYAMRLARERKEREWKESIDLIYGDNRSENRFMLKDIGTWRPENWGLIKQRMARVMGISLIFYGKIIEAAASAILQAYDVSEEFKERAKMEMEG